MEIKVVVVDDVVDDEAAEHEFVSTRGNLDNVDEELTVEEGNNYGSTS